MKYLTIAIFLFINYSYGVEEGSEDINIDQSILETGNKPHESHTPNRLTEIFYYYDPLEGTKARLSRCGAAVTSVIGVGAMLGEEVRKRLPSAENYAETIWGAVLTGVEENPLSPAICGGALGAACTVGALYGFKDSLKPATEHCIKSFRDSLVQNLRHEHQKVNNFKADIFKKREYLKKLTPLLQEESDRKQKEAVSCYEKSLKEYTVKVDKVSDKLKSFVKGYFSLYFSAGNTISNNNTSYECFQAGSAVDEFIHDGDFRYRSKEILLDKLKPFMGEDELDRVTQILQQYPIKPYYIIHDGPVTKEYLNIEKGLNEDRQNLHVADMKIQDFTKHYMILKADKNGNIPIPDVTEFAKYLPE